MSSFSALAAELNLFRMAIDPYPEDEQHQSILHNLLNDLLIRYSDLIISRGIACATFPFLNTTRVSRTYRKPHFERTERSG